MADEIKLQDLLDMVDKSKKDDGISKWNSGNSLVEFIAQDSTNKLDSREQLIDGKEMKDALPAEMIGVLKNSKWKRLRKRLGKELSRTGQAAVVIDLIENTPFISLGKLIDFTRIAGKLVEVRLYTGDVMVVEGAEGEVEHPIEERWFIEDGAIKKMYGIIIDNEWITEGEVITLPANITRIPVKIFDNNEESKSDVDNTKMLGAIRQMNDFQNKIGETYELTQFGLLVNRNMTGGKTGPQIIKEYKEKRTIEINGADAQLGTGISPIGAPGYVAELTLLIDWLEDKVMKFTFTTRDTTQSGTNKHNAEIGMFNQFAIEYLIDKKEIREEDYADFYSILGLFFGIDLSQSVVELQISEVLQNMLDAMNPETPQVQENINVDETQPTTEEK